MQYVEHIRSQGEQGIKQIEQSIDQNALQNIQESLESL